MAKVAASQSHLIPAPYLTVPQPLESLPFCSGQVFMFDNNEILWSSFIGLAQCLKG